MDIATASSLCKDGSYKRFIQSRLIPFSITRLMPFISTATLTILLARASFNGLAIFGYLMSVFMVATTVLTMPLMVVGNLIAGRKEGRILNTYFYTGVTLALVLGIVATILNYAAFSTLVSLNELVGYSQGQVRSSVIAYLASIIFLSLNSFIFIYMEAIGLQGKVSRSKAVSAGFSISFIVISLGVLHVENPLLYAMASYIISEVVLFAILISYLIISSIKEDVVQRPIKHDFRISAVNSIMRLGMPVALGMGIQKLIYYLLNERLLTINMDFVGLLSVFSSISALLLIPIAAFSQANSLFVSKNKGKCLYSFWPSIAGWALMTVWMCVAGYVILPYLLVLFNLNYSTGRVESGLFLVLICFILSSGFLSFVTSALRGVRDTLIPQVAINTVMIGLFIPFIWSDLFNGASFNAVMYAQSIFLMVSGIALVIRYNMILKRKYNVKFN